MKEAETYHDLFTFQHFSLTIHFSFNDIHLAAKNSLEQTKISNRLSELLTEDFVVNSVQTMAPTVVRVIYIRLCVIYLFEKKLSSNN